MSAGREPWFLWPADDGSRVRLICFPYAGAGASLFHGWRERFGSLGVDVLPLQLPGRETRIGEDLIDDLSALVDGAATALLACADRPLVFFGYSLGAWLAFEVARALRRRGAATPVALFVGAAIAPHRPDPVPPISHLEGDAFVDAVRRYLGTAGEAWEHPELVELMVPILRSDIRAVETYEYTEEAPLAIPIHAFAGADDSFVSPSDVAAWAEHTSASFVARTLAGGHFFINESVADLQDAIARDLAALIRTEPA